jgi:hypothetical protein
MMLPVVGKMIQFQSQELLTVIGRFIYIMIHKEKIILEKLPIGQIIG